MAIAPSSRDAEWQRGLQVLSAKRDGLKQRWKDHVQINQTLHERVAQAEANVRRDARRRQQERSLLNLYRKLSHLTGYISFGREIRAMETELAAMTINDPPSPRSSPSRR